MSRHHPVAALAAYERAIALRPTLSAAHNGRGMALKDLARLEEGVDSFREAVRVDPNNREAFSNLVYSLHFDPRARPEQILSEHREWSRRFADPLAAVAAPHDQVERSPDRRLRIGYVSPNLLGHPVGLSMLPILPNHDRAAFDVVVFSDVEKPDAVTGQLRPYATEWHDTARLSEAKLAALVRERKIDILIDLVMHMTRNRLLTFARRPAPVQASFLAYPATSGVAAIDYRITDPLLDPPGETERFNSERLVRLPHSFWGYPESATAAEVAPLPAVSNGYVTFGSLNNPAKITSATVELWSRVMTAVPTAKLLLLRTTGEPGVVDHQVEMFAARGVSPERIELVGRRRRGEYLRVYDRIDIGLDPLPYNGHFTSCDALFMGVPVVSLRGATSVGRGGASLLEVMGLAGDLLAHTPEQFVAIASRLASDLPPLAALRAGLRPRMRQSPLRKPVEFTRALEAAYRSMWRRFCEAG